MRQRKSIRLREYDYSSPGAYFVTTVIRQRECLFGDILEGEMQLNEFGLIARDEWYWTEVAYPGVEVDEFVVMPNHFHGIVMIPPGVGGFHETPLQMTITERRRMLLAKIIGRFKMRTAKRVNLLRGTVGQPFWQQNYYEHVARNEKSLERIRRYIVNNPGQWHEDRFNPDRRGREDS